MRNASEAHCLKHHVYIIQAVVRSHLWQLLNFELLRGRKNSCAPRHLLKLFCRWKFCTGAYNFQIINGRNLLSLKERKEQFCKLIKLMKMCFAIKSALSWKRSATINQNENNGSRNYNTQRIIEVKLLFSFQFNHCSTVLIIKLQSQVIVFQNRITPWYITLLFFSKLQNNSYQVTETLDQPILSHQHALFFNCIFHAV